MERHTIPRGVRLRRPVGGGRTSATDRPGHIGAHTGESQAAVRVGTKARQLENANVAEWSAMRLLPLAWRRVSRPARQPRSLETETPSTHRSGRTAGSTATRTAGWRCGPGTFGEGADEPTDERSSGCTRAPTTSWRFPRRRTTGAAAPTHRSRTPRTTPAPPGRGCSTVRIDAEFFTRARRGRRRSA